MTMFSSRSPELEAKAGGRRFWRTILVFAILNLAAWLAYHRIFGPRRLELLRVESMSPSDGAQVDARPVLTWRFNLDVERGGTNQPAPGTITPLVAGRWQWRDGRTLTFTPDQDLTKATRFTLT